MIFIFVEAGGQLRLVRGVTDINFSPVRNDWEVFGLLAAFRAPELHNNFNGEQRSEFIIF